MSSPTEPVATRDAPGRSRTFIDKEQQGNPCPATSTLPVETGGGGSSNAPRVTSAIGTRERAVVGVAGTPCRGDTKFSFSLNMALHNPDNGKTVSDILLVESHRTVLRTQKHHRPTVAAGK